MTTLEKRLRLLDKAGRALSRAEAMLPSLPPGRDRDERLERIRKAVTAVAKARTTLATAATVSKAASEPVRPADVQTNGGSAALETLQAEVPWRAGGPVAKRRTPRATVATAAAPPLVQSSGADDALAVLKAERPWRP